MNILRRKLKHTLCKRSAEEPECLWYFQASIAFQGTLLGNESYEIVY